MALSASGKAFKLQLDNALPAENAAWMPKCLFPGNAEVASPCFTGSLDSNRWSRGTVRGDEL